MTTLPAPTMAFSPMVMPPNNVAPEPMEAPRLTSVLWQSQSSSVLSSPKRARRSRIAIIDKRDSMSDEDLGLDSHAFTNERMTRDLATRADLRAFLDLNERADLRLIANLAAVKIDKRRNSNVPTKPDVWRDSFVVGHRTTHRRIGSAGANLGSDRANDGIMSCG